MDGFYSSASFFRFGITSKRSQKIKKYCSLWTHHSNIAFNVIKINKAYNYDRSFLCWTIRLSVTHNVVRVKQNWLVIMIAVFVMLMVMWMIMCRCLLQCLYTYIRTIFRTPIHQIECRMCGNVPNARRNVALLQFEGWFFFDPVIVRDVPSTSKT
jgi:hypothetical protein